MGVRDECSGRRRVKGKLRASGRIGTLYSDCARRRDARNRANTGGAATRASLRRSDAGDIEEDVVGEISGVAGDDQAWREEVAEPPVDAAIRMQDMNSEGHRGQGVGPPVV